MTYDLLADWRAKLRAWRDAQVKLKKSLAQVAATLGTSTIMLTRLVNGTSNPTWQLARAAEPYTEIEAPRVFDALYLEI